MSDRLRIAVLAGGLSYERQASLLSGHNVLNVLQDAGHDARLMEPNADMLTGVAEHDLVFMAVHGRLGEDGTLQSMLDFAGVVYTGATAAASALAWNKPIAKHLLSSAGIPTPRYVQFSAEGFRELGASRLVRHVHRFADAPLVVKPAMGGSALGVTRVDDPDELPRALMHAMSYSEVVLVEEYVEGTEVAVPIVDGRVLVPVEVQATSDAYDYEARYSPDGANFWAPARLDEDVTEAVRDVALRTWQELHGRHLGRVDMIVDANGTPSVLELATCPGLTETSVVPLAAQAAGGGGFGAIVEEVVAAALRDAPKTRTAGFGDDAVGTG